MRCPICLDEVPLTVLAGCSHAACQPCLAQFFTTLETTGTPSAKCPMPDCHTPVAPEAVWSLLGRAYKPAAAETATNTDPHEVDQATAEWLESETKLCGGCGARVCKSDGCDKMQCLCGYRFCWRCGSVDATCNCNPGHGFFDNVMRRPDFSRDTRQATALEAQDMATFLAQVRRSMDEAEAHKLAMREELEASGQERDPTPDEMDEKIAKKMELQQQAGIAPYHLAQHLCRNEVTQIQSDAMGPWPGPLGPGPLVPGPCSTGAKG